MSDKKGDPVKAVTFLEILDAAHLTKFVNSPFKTRGGILLIGPPETIKTTLIQNALDDYPDAMILSDINVQQLIQMKEEFSGGKITTLAFTEFAKLYARNPSVAANIEGHIQAFCEEGFTVASFQDKRMSSVKARALIVAAITEKFYQSKFQQWMDSGFARRFLHCLYRLSDPWVLADAQEARKLIELDGILRKWPGNKNIEFSVTPEEMKWIRKLLRHHFMKGVATPFHLAANIFAVLKWKYNAKKAHAIFLDFSESLTMTGAMLELK